MNTKRQIVWPLVIGLPLFTIFALTAIGFGLNQAWVTWDFLADAETLTAEVLSNPGSCDDDGCTYRPVFAIMQPGGTIQELSTQFGASNYGFSEGSEKTILINPAYDYVRIPGFSNLWLLSLAGIFFGGIGLAIMAAFWRTAEFTEVIENEED